MNIEGHKKLHRPNYALPARAICDCGAEFCTTVKTGTREELLRIHGLHQLSMALSELGFFAERRDLDDFVYIHEMPTDGTAMGTVTLFRRPGILTEERPQFDSLGNEVTVVFTDGDGNDLLTLHFDSFQEFYEHTKEGK